MSAATQEPAAYWLLTWLESQKIRTSAQAAAALRQRSTLHDLRDVAEQWSGSVAAPPDGVNLVAGTGLRLDDYLTCPSPACRRQQVDVLFRHAWHYFDQILLPDGVGHLLLNPPHGWSTEYIQEALLNLVDVVLHIQQLGAGPLVSYYPPTKSAPPVLDEVLAGHRGDRWDEAWRHVENTLIAE